MSEIEDFGEQFANKRVLQPEIEKMGTLKENGDILGTQKLKKVLMGTRGPKWGPAWEQCIRIQFFQVA